MNWEAFFLMLGVLLGGCAFIALVLWLGSLAVSLTGSPLAGLLVVGATVAIGASTLFGLVAP